jgi:glutaredoxin
MQAYHDFRGGNNTIGKAILFSLEDCPKCHQTKQLIGTRDDVDIITFPHDLKAWTQDDLNIATMHQVLDDLKITAPILWIDGQKTIGYLRIRKWLQETAQQTETI